MFSSKGFSNEAKFYLEGSCKAPTVMKFDPPLPDGYTAWIHRAGWVLYVHDSSKTCSWMHPGKLAKLKARGLEGPGKYGPEMHIWEKNVNRGGHYVIDYGYPPWGKPRMVARPTPVDFQEIDRIGFEAWEAKNKARFAAHAAELEAKLKENPDALEEEYSKGGPPQEFWEVRRRVMQEQGIIPSDNQEPVNDEGDRVTAQE